MRPLADLFWGRALAGTQGVFYLVTGIWPWVSISTFVAVTGPKEDIWLVQTVGALVIAIGLALMAAAVRGAVDVPVRVLGLASGLAFVFVDVVFYLDGEIGAVYLVDAVAELLLVVAWAVWWSATASRAASPGALTP